MKMLAAKIFPFIAILMLAGCAAPQYGNFSTASDGTQKYIASDAVAQMTYSFPPAKTKLAFKQAITDGFGQAFLEGLRTNGYAVVEYADDQDNEEGKAPSDIQGATYTVDDIGDILRLTIVVGQRSLTRAYIRQDNGLYTAAGYWVFKE